MRIFVDITVFYCYLCYAARGLAVSVHYLCTNVGWRKRSNLLTIDSWGVRRRLTSRGVWAVSRIKPRELTKVQAYMWVRYWSSCMPLEPCRLYSIVRSLLSSYGGGS